MSLTVAVPSPGSNLGHALSRLARLPLTLFLCAALVLPGCTNPNSIEPDDPNDVCRPERAALRSTGEFFAQDIIQGAAIGAIGGGLIGLAATGNARGALLGALAGGAVGAAGGYWAARQKQSQNQAQLFQSVYGDIQRDNDTIDKTQYAFDRLQSCRSNEAARIRADLRAGRINRDIAGSQMSVVRAHAESDLRLAAAISNHIQERGNDFTYASTQVRQTSGGGGSAPLPGRGGGRPTARQPANSQAQMVEAATSTNLHKRDQFQQSIQRAQANTRTGFELS